VDDIRWRAFGLLFSYLMLGMTFLGFSRKPFQVLLLILSGMILDMLLNGVLKGRKVFPLSAMVSCSSLAILLNWSFDFHFLFLPVFICIASKYIFTLDGKHFFNPSLFAICFCILFCGDFITLSPAYQWYGSAQSAWMMVWFVISGAFMLFVFKINRIWLIGSFIITFILQTILRAYILKHVIPFETLFIGALTSPAFYLFTFYMITDPATSPSKKWDQILVGFFIALLDLIFHLKFSLYTFFFAGITVATSRFLYFHIKKAWVNPDNIFRLSWVNYMVIFIISIPVFWSFHYYKKQAVSPESIDMRLQPVPATHSGLEGRRGQVIEAIDPRLAHVGKWVLSVGDAASVADVNNDGLPDIFLTQPLKHYDDQGKLYLNKGGLRFEKIKIPDLEKYIGSPIKHGVPGFSFFFDYDNDDDKDLFVGFGFGKSHLFQNQLSQTGSLKFVEVSEPDLDMHTVCLAANALDYDNDGRLDLLLTNTLHQYLPDYGNKKVPLNIFNLPQPEYPEDRRMYHFMHESWHNANNGGLNYLLKNTSAGGFQIIDARDSKLTETRWSLAVGTSDMNNDGYTDIVIANDFGRDDWYINDKGRGFIRQEGSFYGDIGLDTYKGMNASVADFDGNGKEDVYISNVHHEMQAEGSLLWMNFTKDHAMEIDYSERAQRYNLLNTNRFGWGAATGDLDLNGWIDVVQANGMVDDLWDKKWKKAQNFWYYQAQIARTGPEIHSYADKWADIRGCYIYPNEEDRISLNMGHADFRDATAAVGFVHKANTRGVGLADFDNDGDLEVLVTNQFGDPFLYQNITSRKAWVGIVPEGNGISTNKDAVGSKVVLQYKLHGVSRTQMREVRLVNGFLAMGDQRLLFGLDSGEGITDVQAEIHWHNGKKEVITDLKINEYNKITQK
jgi:hypothetical protein